MKLHLDVGGAPVSDVSESVDVPSHQSEERPQSKGPIEFRFVLKFAPQLSTPCSRGLSIKPRDARMLARRAPRLFQTYLQRHSVLQ